MRVGGHGDRRDDAHQLPVPGRRPFLRTFEEPAGDCRCPLHRGTALEILDVPEAELLEVGEVEVTHGLGDVAEGVGPLVAVLGRVRQLARTNRVQHDHTGARHLAILRSAWTSILGFLGLAIWIVGTISIAAGVTWLVVKLFPGDEKLKPKPQP